MYQVTVSNIGCVYQGESAKEAQRIFEVYCEQAQSDYGRAAGETVVLWEDGEPIEESEPQ